MAVTWTLTAGTAGQNVGGGTATFSSMSIGNASFDRE